MKTIIVFSLILAVAFSSTLKLQEQLLRDLWDQWKQTHQKFYTMSDDQAKFLTFSENYLQILEHNALNTEVVLGLNAFADLSLNEFESQYLGFNADAKKSNSNVETHVFDTKDLPESVDWREKGAVNEVKNQGKCGSCWTFSAIAALEGLHFIDTGKLESFSEQNLVDCAHGVESKGCDGGLMSDAFDYTAENGIQYEADYPYTAKTGTCHADKSKAVNVNIGYKNVTANTEQLKAAIAQQPVSVAVQAGGLPWQFYKTGVIRWFCGDKLNHGITAVGYGKSKGTEAFIVRNSWGPTWGDKGYVHISTAQGPNRGHGVCGILADNSFPISK